jgi:chromosomal replication initiator protein
VTVSLDSKTITVEDILVATSQMSGFTVEALRGPLRRQRLVHARHLAMYVVREKTDLSFPAIAKAFGGRDHTTVIHAVNKIAELIFAADERMCKQLAELDGRLDVT